MIKTAIVLSTIMLMLIAGSSGHYGVGIAAHIEKNIQESVHDSWTRQQARIISGGLDTAASLADQAMSAIAGTIGGQGPQVQSWTVPAKQPPRLYVEWQE